MIIISRTLSALAALILMGSFAMAETTPIRESEPFSSVQNPEKILALLPTLPIDEVLTPTIIIRKSPLKAVMRLTFEDNRFRISLRIINDNSFEWFINTSDHFTVSLDLKKILSEERISRSPVRRDDDVDGNYTLLRPGEILAYDATISAKWLYENHRSQNIYIYYTVTGVPPMIKERASELAERAKKANVSNGVYLESNSVRMRCYDYDTRTGRYVCDFDNSLPN